MSDYVAANYRLKRKSLIALGVILQKRSLSASDLTKELQLTEQDRLRTYVDTLLTNEIVITKGVGKGTKYEISPIFLTRTKVQSPTTLKTIEPHRLKALILEDLRFYPNSSIGFYYLFFRLDAETQTFERKKEVTAQHDIRRFWITNVLGKEDPYLKIGC